MPLLNEAPQPSPPPPQSHSLSGHQRTSLANRFCPFCKSQLLQYTSNTPSFKPPTALATSASPRVTVLNAHPVVDSNTDGPTGKDRVKSGFVVSDDVDTTEHSLNSKSVRHTSDGNAAVVKELSGTGEWERLEKAHCYDSVSISDPQSDVKKNSECLVPPDTDQKYATASWSFGELSGSQAPQNLRSSHDVLYHSDTRDLPPGSDHLRHDTSDTINDTRDTNYSSRIDSRHDTRDEVKDTQSKTRHKYNTIHGSDSRGGDFSHSGGRLTNSEPIPKLQPYTNPGHVTDGQQNTNFRRHLSTEQPKFKQRNPFDDRGMLYNQSSTDPAPSLSRMKLQRGSLSSVQEQPVSKSLNPFDDESCSTNPFDEEVSSSNPLGEEDEREEEEGEEREGREGEEVWRQHTQKDRGHSVSQNEERYFTDFQAHHREARAEHCEDKRDFETAIPRGLYQPQPSSSVPATSYMEGLVGHMTFGNMSHDHRMMPNKSSTLPCSRSPRSTQESPEVSSKRRTTLPQGKPPIYGGMVRGKSMESLNRTSPKNEQHPTKSNRISPQFGSRREEPYGNDPTSRSSAGRDVRGSIDNMSKSPRNTSSTPSSGSSGKSTPEMTRRGNNSSDASKGQLNIHSTICHVHVFILHYFSKPSELLHVAMLCVLSVLFVCSVSLFVVPT